MEIDIQKPGPPGVAMSKIVWHGTAPPDEFPRLASRVVGFIRQVGGVECDIQLLAL
jgi:hypothetical protein